INASQLTTDTINAIKKPEKAFYIQAYNDEGELLERFEKFTMYNEDDLRGFLKAVDKRDWNPLIIIAKPQMSLDQRRTLLAVQNALIEKINGPTKIFSKRIMFDQEGKPLMEWDVILVCEDRVFLYEAKHNMTLRNFQKTQVTSDLEFKQFLRKQCIGVACGSKFPGNLKDLLGLIVIFPG
ncbi:10077_t:CDS:2, partial [Gigaspora rosea]